MSDKPRDPGYRGSLPPRVDRMARPWVLTVIGAFVLIFVLALAGIPSRFIPQPSGVPLPSVPAPSASVSPSGSG
jgi:hypothetical protein